MSKSELIACFQDTLKISNKEPLRKNTIKSQKTNKIYREGFVSNKPRKNENSSIIVEKCTTFASANKYRNLGRVAILNFANPENPGGGVQLGAMAQEECLCRSSNLYPCLNDISVYEDYYGYHRNQKKHFYSDRLIYTKDVMVFKDDSDVPQIMPKEDWFIVDVITCAAPYLAKCGYINTEALLRLFKSRIKNIFEAARDNDINVIILGAFGCGAFRNPPLVVAEAFRQVICENNYQQDFKHIVFAIKPTSEYCENVSVFSTQFDRYAPDATGRCVLLAQDLNQRFSRIPNLGDRIKIRDGKDFLYNWQVKNKYFKKQFSILGDSISTLEGFNPKGYKVFFTGENCNRANIIKMEDTWWDKVISFFGGELLINNSWSGSRVTKIPGNEVLFPSGCSDERTLGLHMITVMPDVIIVYLGTNDWAFGASIGNDTHILNDDNKYFELAYDNMLKKIKSNYPNAEVWCCTLSETYISNKPTFKFPHMYSGTHIEEYNNIIRRITQRNRCKVIDLYEFHMPYDSIDGTHPSAEGMNTIAFEIIRTIAGAGVNRFIDFAGSKDNCEVLNGFIGGTKKCEPKCADDSFSMTRSNCKYYLFALGNTVVKEDGAIWYKRDRDNHKWIQDQEWYRRYYDAQYDVVEIVYDEYSEEIIRKDKTKGFWLENEAMTEKPTIVGKKIKNESDHINEKPDELIGTRVGERYEILKLIGLGGVCKVYLAQDLHLSKLWAFKVCDKSSKTYNPAIYESIMKEATLMIKLDHPAIPKVIDIIENERYIYIVHEYVEGTTLDNLLKLGVQSVENVIDWSKQICLVLNYLHSLKPAKIHRDIKPANLILMYDGRIKLIDFGIMREFDPNKTADTCCLGTRGYAAPEQFGGRGQTDARTDIYGLGMTMFHLVTGVDPKDAPYKIMPICKINPSLPKGLEYIITKCTQVDPEARYQNCWDLINDLNNYTHLPPKNNIFKKVIKRLKGR